MEARVELREVGDDRVLVDEQGIAGDEVAAIDALADEDGVLEGAVVVLDVELVEAAIDAGELERSAAHPDRSAIARHPVRGVACRDHEVDGRRAARRRRGVATGSAESERQRGEGENRPGRGDAHRQKYTAKRLDTRRESCDG